MYAYKYYRFKDYPPKLFDTFEEAYEAAMDDWYIPDGFMFSYIKDTETDEILINGEEELLNANVSPRSDKA